MLVFVYVLLGVFSVKGSEIKAETLFGTGNWKLFNEETDKLCRNKGSYQASLTKVFKYTQMQFNKLTKFYFLAISSGRLNKLSKKSI